MRSGAPLPLHRWAPWLAVLVIVLGVTNSLVFIAVSAALGGDALNGHVTDGHYYVASHGGQTEVSATVWTISRSHALVTLGSWPFVMLAGAFLLIRIIFPYLMAGRAPGHARERVAMIRASGSPTWQGSPGGVAGGVRASSGLLGAAVYPGGIVVTPRFMKPFAIPAKEIRSIKLGRRFTTSTIEIEHDGIDVSSPFVLYGGAASPQAIALMSLASGTRDDRPTPPADPVAGGRVNVRDSARPANLDADPTTRATVPGPMRVMSVLGLVVAAVMIVVGILVVIPTAGLFGVAWTGIALLILVTNGRRFIRQGW